MRGQKGADPRGQYRMLGIGLVQQLPLAGEAGRRCRRRLHQLTQFGQVVGAC